MIELDIESKHRKSSTNFVQQSQFNVLYREFLFRVIDVELLSSHAQGSASKLLGQFAALLLLFGALFSLGMPDAKRYGASLYISAWPIEHILIATTMLVAGLFAVLSWDSIFPDRRDVLILAPLPVRTRTLFFAKTAACGHALGLAVIALNTIPALALSFALTPPGHNMLEFLLTPALYRTFFAYWITMLSAGGFTFACVLCVQAFAVQILPRRQYLRASAVLQIATFCLFIAGYFLQPSLATPEAVSAAKNLPSYWFLGLLQELNGSSHPALVPLAQRAWISLAMAGLGTVLAYSLCYFRALRKIAEEPDIVPASQSTHWLPGFGNAFETAIVQFSIRTLLRSRRHRLILAFYLGVGFAITVLFLKTPGPWHHVAASWIASDIVLMTAIIVGTRVVFSMPADLRANWIFRIAPISAGAALSAARRKTLLLLALLPAWTVSAVVFLALWSWKPATAHLIILGLLGLALAEFSLFGAQKIPFACSYLPGRSNFHLTFWICTGLIMQLIAQGAVFEVSALANLHRYAGCLAVLISAAGCARWRNSVTGAAQDLDVQFEEEPSWQIVSLNLRGP